MAININTDIIKKIAGKAGDGFNKIMQSGFKPEGSIFDAASKLGINNTDDLKAGIDMFKENPTETINSALSSLKNQGFNFGINTNSGTQQPQSTGSSSEQNPATSITKDGLIKFAFDKWGIHSTDDLKAGMDLFKEDPRGTAEAATEALGLSKDVAGKVGNLVTKFLA